MFKWFWTIFSLGAPDKNKCELKLLKLTVTIGTFHDELSWRGTFKHLEHSAPAVHQGTEREWKATSKKNNGRVKNRKGVQKEEGGKTFVYDKRNRAITCAYSRDLHLTLCS